MTVSYLAHLMPLALLLVTGWPSTIDAGEYRFFQLKQKLFAIDMDNLQVWHVDRSGHNTTDNHSSDHSFIQLSLVGPYHLETFDQSKVNLTKNGLKFVFVARLGERCSVLALVDSQLYYRGWRIRINLKYFERGSDKANTNPFRLGNLRQNLACDISIPTSGSLTQMAALKGLFEAKQTVKSVWSTDNHTKLYFVGSERYIKLNLDQFKPDKGLPENAVQTVSLDKSDHVDDEQISMIYKNKYILRVGPGHKEVCMVKLLEPVVKFGSKCTSLQYFSKPLGMVLNRNIGLLGDSEEMTTRAPGNHSIIILVVLLAVIVIIVIVVYVVAAKYFCQDSMAVIPFSGLNSKYVGKLRSTSSIKTLNSEEDANSRAGRSKM